MRENIEKIPFSSYNKYEERSLIMTYTVRCVWDEEAMVWIAESDDIPGLVLESQSLDQLMKNVSLAVPELVEMNNLPVASELHYISEKTQRISM